MTTKKLLFLHSTQNYNACLFIDRLSVVVYLIKSLQVKRKTRKNLLLNNVIVIKNLNKVLHDNDIK